VTRRHLRLHRGATEEFDAAADWYESREVTLGQEFIASVDAAIDQLVENPDLGGRVADSAVRRLPLRKFPYAIIYVRRENELFVVAIAHMHRRPGYWRERLPR